MTTASLMVRMAAGVPDHALLLLTADLAARLKVTQVIRYQRLPAGADLRQL